MDWPTAFVMASVLGSFAYLARLREKGSEREQAAVRSSLEKQAEISKTALGEVASMAGSIAANSVGGRPLSLFEAEHELKKAEFDANQRRLDEQVAMTREALEAQRTTNAERARRMAGRNPESA